KEEQKPMTKPPENNPAATMMQLSGNLDNRPRPQVDSANATSPSSPSTSTTDGETNDSVHDLDPSAFQLPVTTAQTPSSSHIRNDGGGGSGGGPRNSNTKPAPRHSHSQSYSHLPHINSRLSSSSTASSSSIPGSVTTGKTSRRKADSNDGNTNKGQQHNGRSVYATGSLARGHNNTNFADHTNGNEHNYDHANETNNANDNDSDFVKRPERPNRNSKTTIGINANINHDDNDINNSVNINNINNINNISNINNINNNNNGITNSITKDINTSYGNQLSVKDDNPKRRQSILVRFHNKEKMAIDILGKKSLQFWDDVRLHYQTERLKTLEKRFVLRMNLKRTNTLW
ncbi:hypothetical protein RFI_16053, partial [Reticulomyxa filosa]